MIRYIVFRFLLCFYLTGKILNLHRAHRWVTSGDYKLEWVPPLTKYITDFLILSVRQVYYGSNFCVPTDDLNFYRDRVTLRNDASKYVIQLTHLLQRLKFYNFIHENCKGRVAIIPGEQIYFEREDDRNLMNLMFCNEKFTDDLYPVGHYIMVNVVV